MMGRPLKIIIIEGYASNKEHYPPPDSDQFYLSCWGGAFARRVAKRYPEADLELWRTEKEFNRISQRKVYGVRGMIFPHKGFVFSFVTWQMIKRMRRLARDYQLVIHRNSIFDWPFVIGISLLFPKARIVISHHGGWPRPATSWRGRISRLLLNLSVQKTDTLTYLRGEIRDWAMSLKRPPKLCFLPVGADFSVFKPDDKLACRKQLGLDPTKTYAVYVGRFYRLKGVDHILDVYSELKTEGLEILLVGGFPGDELYSRVQDSGCRFWGFLDWDVLKVIYSASDFYLHPAFHQEFGGLDVSWMECLACGRPVLSPQFAELDFDYQELGLLLESLGDIIPKTRIMMASYQKFNKCRETALSHLDGNTAIADKLWHIYMNENQ